MPLAFILSGCPFESSVPLEPAPVEAIDTSMLGYWYGIVKDGSDFFGIEALEISKHSDSVYSIIRYGKAVKGDIILPDTAYFTAYTSYLNGQRFFNVESTILTVITKKKKAPEVVTNKIYYLSAFDIHHDTMVVKAVTESFLPVHKTFNNSTDLKQTVGDLITQKKNIYDDLYSLSYHKIPKPVPLKPY